MSKSPKSPATEFVWGSIAEAQVHGIEDMLITEHEETGRPDQPPLDIDWPRYQMLERMGMYVVVFALHGGALVGYRGFFLDPSIHYQSLKWAVNDILYVDPDHRQSWIGWQLIRKSDEMLKTKGVHMVVQADRKAHKLAAGKARATLGDLLIREGYSPLETVYTKRL